jgi:hypothetical protein
MTFEENSLGIFTLVTHTDLLVERSETRFNQVHGAHAIRGKANTCPAYKSQLCILAQVILTMAYPTAENSFASSYSVKEMPFL